MRHYHILGISIELWLVWPLLAALVQLPVMAIVRWLDLDWLAQASYLLFVLTITYMLVFMTATGVNRLLEELQEHDAGDQTLGHPVVITVLSAVPEKALIGAAFIPAGMGFPLTLLGRVTGVDWIGWLGLGLAFLPMIASFALAFSIPRLRR